MDRDSPTFPGFSLPDGAWLPPELMRLLPSLNMAELKVTIAAIYENMQAAGRGAAISLTDFEALTGLSRRSVLRGIHAAVKRGSIRRTQAAGTYIYRLAVHSTGGTSIHGGSGYGHRAGGGKSTPPELIAEMRALGVALKVCQNIAGRYGEDYIIEKLRHARHAIEAGLARNPAGWFVTAIKNDWPAPLGYDETKYMTDEERRLRYVSGEYADLIQR